ncbi:MAG: pentapeptide repeat-containing protein [Candidatus Cloacimonetes bacterium]|nr:pentapeptide repeat-containing protein [Candidatus Cloacimonadota bacterium]
MLKLITNQIKYYKYILMSKRKILFFILLLFCYLSLDARVIQMWEVDDSLRIVHAGKLITTLMNSTQNDTVDFNNCNVPDELNYSKKDTIYCSIVAYGCYFNKNVYFQGITFKNDLDFGAAQFNGKVNFAGDVFNGNVKFWMADFYDITYFWHNTFNSEVNFISVSFNNIINFSNNIFNDKIDFCLSNFKKDANFSKSKFNGKSNFCDATFYNRVYFYNSYFDNMVNFSGATFNDYADFTSIIFRQIILFKNCNFNNIVMFNRSVFKNKSSFFFTNSNAEKFVGFNNIEIDDSAKIYLQDFHFSTGKLAIVWDPLQADKINHIAFLDTINSKFEQNVFSNRGKSYPINSQNITKINRNYLKDKHRLYSILMDNFKAQGDWPSYDGCYYEWKTIELKEFFYNKNFGQKITSLPYYIFNFINYFSCDAGTNPFKLIIVSFVVVLYFSFIYWLRDITIKKLKKWSKCVIFSLVTVLIILAFKNNFLGMLLFIIVLSIFVIIKFCIKSFLKKLKSLNNMKYVSYLYFSFKSFTNIGLVDWYHKKDRGRFLVMIEGALGWLLLGLFIVTYANILLR